MENKMTDRKLWEAYWKNYKFTAIPQKPVYKNYILPKECHSFIEIGGFPGLNAGYFYKHVCTDVTLLDFYVDRQVIHRVERDNGIPADSIKAIEADFFQFQADRTYDMVFSLGFIERAACGVGLTRRTAAHHPAQPARSQRLGAICVRPPQPAYPQPEEHAPETLEAHLCGTRPEGRTGGIHPQADGVAGTQAGHVGQCEEIRSQTAQLRTQALPDKMQVALSLYHHLSH